MNGFYVGLAPSACKFWTLNIRIMNNAITILWKTRLPYLLVDERCGRTSNSIKKPDACKIEIYFIWIRLSGPETWRLVSIEHLIADASTMNPVWMRDIRARGLNAKASFINSIESQVLYYTRQLLIYCFRDEQMTLPKTMDPSCLHEKL